MEFRKKARPLRGKLKVKTVAFLIILVFSCFFSFPPSLRADQSPLDILVFSPHPDDETLCCGGTILKAIQDNKKLKVVFLTNGDAYTECVCQWLKKKKGELTPQDYILLGRERQKEAIRAIEKLGLNKEDAFFLSYPDNGLSSLWKEEYETNYSSETTKAVFSPYKKTYQRAKRGYTKENLLFDIKDILIEYRPKSIYTPHPLDGHRDHQATTHFVNLALEQLMTEGKAEWINSTQVSYYLIHSPSNNWPDEDTSVLKEPSFFSQKQPRSEDIIALKNKKAEALGEYHTQLNIKKEGEILERFIKDNELFWDVPNQKSEYLRELKVEWERIAKVMQGYGYNVNLAPVVDVAEDIEDRGIYLVRRERTYSDISQIVTELASAMVKGLNKGGIVPVLKHFPGLGRCYQNPHKRLLKTEVSKKELYTRDLLPFKKLIKKGLHFWVMIGHVIYPSLDGAPASLSYRIQTELLRKKLGFKGIIVSDEFLNMQAIEEYALQQGIEKPYIGKIVVMAFKAGTDIVIIYPEPDKSEEVIFGVIEAVKKAIKEGRITEKEIDKSVRRILREKERIFNKRLSYLLKDMSLEEKIAQRMIIDIYEKRTQIVSKYNLGGIKPRGYKVIEKVQGHSKIPPFIVGEHEGGSVDESRLKIHTQSVYSTGREFKKTLKQIPRKRRLYIAEGKKKPENKPRESFFDFSQLIEEEQQKIINILCDNVDEYIKFYTAIKQNEKLPITNPDYFSPLTTASDISMSPEIKPFEALPITWLTRFTDKNTALCAYKVFKEVFERWLAKLNRGFDKERFDSYEDQKLYELNLLKEEIKKAKGKGDKKVMRLLCLAAHPDDEDAEALIYFKEKFNAETYILLATRGEGGENLIDSRLYEELGFLRTEEMEKSASILGVKKVYYLGKEDFGFCLEPEEAFKKWGREATLEKLVYFFRLIRPHIIITKHNKFNALNHGQHRALVILAEKAFDLAGDSKVYPEMIKEGLFSWQPLRLYQRSSNKRNFALKDIIINTNETIPSEKKTYHQVAVEALSQHRSQVELANLFLPDKIAYELVKTNSFLKQESILGKGINKPSQRKEEIVPSGFPGVKIGNNFKIGLIEDNSNIFFIALKTLDCDVGKIDTKFIAEGNLSEYDTIILSKGMGNVLSAVEDADKRILRFVGDGGNLVIFLQYFEQEGLTRILYPVEISWHSIFDENSPVIILVPEHPLFNFPNKISSQDFEGWKQERGFFFPFQYSDKYTELTACPDSKSELVKGGYLVAQYGKGAYIITTYSWHRQLREFHLGAYKNLANMIAYLCAKKSPSP